MIFEAAVRNVPLPPSEKLFWYTIWFLHKKMIWKPFPCDEPGSAFIVFYHPYVTTRKYSPLKCWSFPTIPHKGRATEHPLNSTLPIQSWEWARESQVAVITFCHNQPVSTSCSGQNGLSIHVFLFFPVGSTILRFLSHPCFISSLISSIPSLFRSLPVYSSVWFCDSW